MLKLVTVPCLELRLEISLNLARLLVHSISIMTQSLRKMMDISTLKISSLVLHLMKRPMRFQEKLKEQFLTFTLMLSSHVSSFPMKQEMNLVAITFQQGLFFRLKMVNRLRLAKHLQRCQKKLLKQTILQVVFHV